MKAMRGKIKKLFYPFLSKWYEKNNAKARTYKNKGIELTILPEVFHPGYFLSTNILLDFISSKELKNKRVLELGAGSGFISFYLAMHSEAKVTASDINPNAIEGLKLNSEKLQIPIEVVESNLFEKIDLKKIDLILINPPYYPKDVFNNRDAAFYCGEDFDYFKRLFAGLNKGEMDYTVFMILSEDCQIEEITRLADENKLTLKEVHRKKKLQEWNIIYEIEPYE
ncbi:MAG: methyltransferase [Fluviicola sp.]|nr:MAG: methyltransferase [Fluviicola sp.]